MGTADIERCCTHIQVHWEGHRQPLSVVQLGHQAANCTNGTINWRQIYGDEAFRLKDPIYPSDIYRSMKEKEVDIAALQKRAQEWAKVCCSPLQ